MRHPLLLQGALAPLPEAPSAASDDTRLSYLDSFAPGADVPSQAPSQAPADAGSHHVSHTCCSPAADPKCCVRSLSPSQKTQAPGHAVAATSMLVLQNTG